MKSVSLVLKSLVILAGFMFFLSGCSKKYPADMKLIPVKMDSQWGYVDHNGKILINPQFLSAHYFHDGLALVQTTDRKLGYIDADGKIKVNPAYKYATSFHGGLAWVVSQDGRPVCIDVDGNQRIQIDADAVGDFSEGFAPFQKNMKWGFINEDGKIVINPQFDNIGFFSGDLAAVELNNKWGYINKKGEIVINYQFQAVGSFYDGLAGVTAPGGSCGYISEDGKYVINPQFRLAGNFENGSAWFSNGQSYGYIDEKGKIMVNPQFQAAGDYDGDLAPVKSGSQYGYVDKDGKYVINPQFDFASKFFGDFAIVSLGGKFGFIGRDGKYLANPQFDACNPFEITPKFDGTVVQSDFADWGTMQSEITDHVIAIAKNAYQNWTRPQSSFGFMVNQGYYNIPTDLYRTTNAYYQVYLSGYIMNIRGISYKDPASFVSVTLYSVGALGGWYFSGKFAGAIPPNVSTVAETQYPTTNPAGGPKQMGGLQDSNRDAVINDLNNLMAKAQQYFRKPKSMGGGKVLLLDLRLPVRISLILMGSSKL